MIAVIRPHPNSDQHYFLTQWTSFRPSGGHGNFTVAKQMIPMQITSFHYDNQIVRNFGIATIFWGIVGMTVGLLVAVQLVWPFMNFELQYTTLGRILPLHTYAVIFAFVGNAIFMGAYYSLQPLLRAIIYSDRLSRIHFWGWQLVVVAAAVTLPLG